MGKWGYKLTYLEVISYPYLKLVMGPPCKDPFVRPKKGKTPIESYSGDGIRLQ